MNIHIENYQFTCPYCEKSFNITLEECCGVEECPQCLREFDWEINVSVSK